MDSDSTDQLDGDNPVRDEAGWYRIELRGRLDDRWAAWFDGMTLDTDLDGTTVLRGPVEDQAALHGLLARLRDVNLPLVSVQRIAVPNGSQHRHRGEDER